MNEIKEYKQLTTIQTFDGEVMTEASISDLDELLKSGTQFIRIWDEIINKNQIKKIYVKRIDSISNFILSFSKDVQEKLKTREKEKKLKVWRWFYSIEEIQNYMKDKQLV